MSVPPDPRHDSGTDDAVARVRAELAALPQIPMPPDVATRIGAALAATDTRTGVRRRRRRFARAGVALACSAAAAGFLLVIGFGESGPGDGPRPVGVEDELRSTGQTAFGRDGAGALADPERRRSCLAGAGVPDPDAALLGGMPYAVDGAPGTLLVLGDDVVGRYRLVVVDPGCRRTLASTTAGR